MDVEKEILEIYDRMTAALKLVDTNNKTIEMQSERITMLVNRVNELERIKNEKA